MEEKKGLYGKYIIKKADGSPVDPDAKYFVLRYDRKGKDYRARDALRYYAINVGGELAREILEALSEKDY